MKNKIELDEKAICDEYLNTRIGTEAIALKYHVGKKRIKEIFERYGIETKKKGKQPLKGEFAVSDWKIEKYPAVEGRHYIARDRVTGYETRDYMNQAGFLTTYIKETYDMFIPTLYDRRMYYMRTGNYWWEQWFDIISMEDTPVKICPYCGWKTRDINNMSGMFLTHLMKCHSITKQEHLENHPEDREYLSLVSPINNRQMETDENKYVICKICGKKVSHINGRHLLAHGITFDEYIEKYGDGDLVCKDFHDQMSSIAVENNKNMPAFRNSKDELEIKKFIEEHGLETRSDREILGGREIDIYIPSLRIGIEYNGNKWHTECFGNKDKYYHKRKTDDCIERGVKLIQIFQDEYLLHKDIVLNKLSHLLGFDSNKPKVFGRKCVIKEIYKHEAKDFLDKYHIQGSCNSSVQLGAFYNSMLIGVMTFKKYYDGMWELVRFATDYNFTCCGVGGKLFKYFTTHFEYNEIKSFADRRWTINENRNVYTNLGFVNDGHTLPSYTYYYPKLFGDERKHRDTCRKNKLLKIHPELDPKMSEGEMTKALGYDRIWDCGLIRYIYRNPKYEQQYNAVRGQKAVIH